MPEDDWKTKKSSAWPLQTKNYKLKTKKKKMDEIMNKTLNLWTIGNFGVDKYVIILQSIDVDVKKRRMK